MANLNRGRVSVRLGEHWREHARIVPVHLTPLGTVERKGLVQSLGIDAHGDYWAFGTGTPELLPNVKVQSAIAAIKTREAPSPLGSEKDG